MKEITYFYLKGCPYCRKADGIIADLIAENPAYAAVPIRKIEERQEAEIADSYDYYFVPCLWIGEEKLLEGPANVEKIREIFEKALH